MKTTTSRPPRRRRPHKPPRVQPSDPILLEYLYNRLHGNPVSTTLKVIECSLYSEQEPWEIWESNGGNELEPDSRLNVITKLKKLSTKMDSCNKHARRVGRCGGSWQGEDSGLDIPNAAGRFVGVKKRFRYENEKGSWRHEQHGRWIMYQFVLNDDMLPTPNTDDYAICTIKKNYNKTSGRKRKKKDTESVVVLPPRPRRPRKRNIVNKIKPQVVLGVAHPAIHRMKKAKTDAESVVLLPPPPPAISQPLNCDSDKEKPQEVVPYNINDADHDSNDDDEDHGPGCIARFAEELLTYRLPSDIDMEADPLIPNMQYTCCHEHFMGWQKFSN